MTVRRYDYGSTKVVAPGDIFWVFMSPPPASPSDYEAVLYDFNQAAGCEENVVATVVAHDHADGALRFYMPNVSGIFMVHVRRVSDGAILHRMLVATPKEQFGASGVAIV